MQRFLDDKYYSALYNCSSFNSTGELPIQESSFGTLYFVFGIIGEVLYVPLILTMFQKKYFERPFYKISMCLGAVNAVNIAIMSILGGHLMAEGAVFCSNPTLIYVSGVILTSTVMSSFALCCVMGFYQCLEVSRIRLLMTFFGGSKVWLWILLLVCINIRMAIYEMPLVIDPARSSWSYDPFAWLPPDATRPTVANVRYGSDANTAFALAITGLLLIEVLYLFIVNPKETTKADRNRSDRKMVKQALAICIVSMLAGLAAFYIYNFTSHLAVIATFVLQLNNVFPALVYINRDRNLRQDAFGRMIACCTNCKSAVQDAANATSQYSDTETSHTHNVVIA